MSLVHWLIVLAVVILLFGPRRLPELAKGMGEAIREFKKAVGGPDQQKTQITSGQQNPVSSEPKA
jgi:sec-independent protein translocase protein TatA